MNSVDEFLSQIPISELAGQMGVSEAEAEQAARQAVPALLSGMRANARDPGGAASLEEALGQHQADPFPPPGLGQVDTADGEKIVNYVFGPRRPDVESRLGAQQSGGSGILSKLLPILAPLVLSWLAGQRGGNRSAGASAGDSSGIGLDDLLGGLLGAGSGTGSSTGSSLDMSDILGDLLGGGRKSLAAVPMDQKARSTIP